MALFKLILNNDFFGYKKHKKVKKNFKVNITKN